MRSVAIARYRSYVSLHSLAHAEAIVRTVQDSEPRDGLLLARIIAIALESSFSLGPGASIPDDSDRTPTPFFRCFFAHRGTWSASSSCHRSARCFLAPKHCESRLIIGFDVLMIYGRDLLLSFVLASVCTRSPERSQ